MALELVMFVYLRVVSNFNIEGYENEISLINRRHQYLVSTVALDNHVLNMHVKCKYHFVRLRIICGECKYRNSPLNI